MRHVRHWVFGLALLLLAGGAGCISISGNQPTTAGPLGLFVTTDKGENWQQFSTYPTPDGAKILADVSVYRLVPDPEDTRALYWLSREQGFFYSYNEGKIWQHPDTGPFAGGFVYSLVVHPKNKCVLYATNGTQVFRSDDCSRSWVEVYRESRSDTTISSLTMSNVAPYQLYLAESAGDVLKSADGGLSWEVVRRFNTPLVQIAADTLQNNVLYVIGRKDGLFVSTDGGTNWMSRKNTFDNYSGALEFRRFWQHPGKRNVLYWISTYGILRSEDGGATWTDYKLITPPGSAQIYGFAVNAKNDKEMYYTATINDRSTFYKSADGGTTWITKKLPSGQLPTVLYVHPDKPNILYLGFSQPPKQ